MDPHLKIALAADIHRLGSCFWAGEAEICRQFWDQPRSPKEEARWLRLQVFKEMYGSGLTGHPDGLIRSFLENLGDRIGTVKGKDERDAFERSLRILREEYNHFRLFADILESVTGELIDNLTLVDWQTPEDRKLQEIRQQIREEGGLLGELAIMFTEGGGSAFFLVARELHGDPIRRAIAQASTIVYADELEHGEHGALELENRLDSEEEWQLVKEMIMKICQQRLRMRYDMFGLPINETRISEISEGQIAPLK